jgi:hypothetical protein
MENPPSRLLLRNYAACRGAWGATNPRVASLGKELPHAADGGPEELSPASLAGWGETETSFRESVRRRRKETHVRDVDRRAAGPNVPTPT